MVVLCWFRFKKRWNHIATEVGRFSADVVGSDGKYLYEFEVKVSIRDLQADFQKKKHRDYADIREDFKRGTYWIPNKFFFAVPEDMIFAAEDALHKYPNYGLVTVNWEKWWREPVLKTVKQAKFLHKNPPGKKVLDLILHRMSSEICGHYIRNEAEQNKRFHITKLVKRLIKYERTRMW